MTPEERHLRNQVHELATQIDELRERHDRALLEIDDAIAKLGPATREYLARLEARLEKLEAPAPAPAAESSKPAKK